MPELNFLEDLALSSWRNLNQILPDLTEEQCLKMLEHEIENQKRRTIFLRLHQRYVALRATRERKELLIRMNGEEKDEEELI